MWASGTVAVHNETHIICVTDDNSTVFFYPPRPQKATESSVIVPDDWGTKTSTTFHFGPVLDKRWEDFPLVYESLVNIPLERSLALSVYIKEITELKFYVSNDDFLEIFDLDLEKYNQSWIHYYIDISTENFCLYENNNLVSSVNMIPTKFDAVASNGTYWKIHNHTFHFNNSISTKWTRINLHDSCYVLHASTCSDCYINVSTSTGANYSLSSNNTETMWTWTSQTLSFGSSTDNYVDILRKTHSNNIHGFWGLDIRQCPKKTKNGQVLYERFLEETLAEETFCSTLNRQDSKNDNFIHRDCNVGELGNKCDVTCEEILNDDICEKRKICYDQRCRCAWGYGGKYCQNQCEGGKWGVDCENSCMNCSVCNKVTGECLFNKVLENSPIVSGREIEELNNYSNNSTDSKEKENSGKSEAVRPVTGISAPCMILLLIVIIRRCQ